MGWDRHWHGYGPWVGPADALRDESLRRPGPDPNDAQTQAFLASHLPPVLLGHYRLRRGQTTADRTWIDVSEALVWLEDVFGRHPCPILGDGTVSGWGYSIADKLKQSADALARGNIAYWHYYLPSFSVAVYAVLSCPPGIFHRSIPCPFPPG